jgi:hypothetical protein
MNSADKKIVEAVADLWIEMGGDAEGIYWLVDEIKEAIEAKLQEKNT